MLASSDLSKEIFAIVLLTALKSSLEHSHKHVLQLLQRPGFIARKELETTSALWQGGHKPGKHGKPGKLRESEKLSKSQGKLREI